MIGDNVTDLFKISNVEAPTEGEVDKWGFTIKPTISDNELILRCLSNAPCGSDKKQVERLIKIYENRKKEN
jgi:hypothetical protein|tara:strand:+ start:910 stop:1122 length:213 start_codon:yes stop_codon:yes gene_type:complete